MAAWKRTERSIAARLYGQRVGNSGRNTEDVAHAWLSVEVKHRKSLPAWLVDAVAQACRNAEAAKLPIAVLHEHGQRHDNDLVIMRLADFTAWFGDADLENAESGAF